MSQKLLRTAIAAGLALALGGCSLFSSDSPRAPVKLTEIQQSATVNTVCRRSSAVLSTPS